LGVQSLHDEISNAQPSNDQPKATQTSGRPKRRRRARSSALAGLVLIGGAALAACSSSTASSTSSTTASASLAADKHLPVVPLIIYNGKNYLPGTAEAFSKKTGIPTEEVSDSTGILLAKIEAEKNHPQWGVFWSDGAAAYAALDAQHMLVRGFEPDTGALTSIGQKLVPSDKSYIPTAITVAGAIVYNPATVPTPPTNFTQLTEPQWKGAVGMNNPAISGPTYTAVAGIMNQVGGIQKGETYFTKLAANGVHVYTTNKVTLNALLQGQIKLAIVQNNAGIELAEKYPQLKVAYPADATVLPSVIGIDAKVSKSEIAEAERFADFVYSQAGQQVMQKVNPYGGWPILRGVQAAPLLPSLSSLPLQFLNTGYWGDSESAINQWFTAHVVNG
jgi:iron(III) transport system substrate-binding protein